MKRLLGKGVVGIIVGLVLLLALPALAFAAAPDVTVTDISVSPSVTKINQESTVTATIKNMGDATATGTWAYFEVTSGSITYTPQNVTGMALDPDEVQAVSVKWTPVATGTHTIKVTAGTPDDTNKANDVSTLDVDVVSAGTVEIKNLFATPILIVDKDGCATLVPLTVSGFVQEDNVGTNDGVLIYIDEDLFEYVLADAANDGYFETEIEYLCFEAAGEYTLTVKVNRNGANVVTAQTTFEVIFADVDGDDGDGYGTGLVDVEGMPRILRLGAGEFSEYLISVENLGTGKDTYSIKISSSSAVDQWLDLETNIITLSAGQIGYVSLFVDVASDAPAGSYPINLIVQGDSTDIDRLYLVIQNDGVTDIGDGKKYVASDYAVDVEVTPAKLDAEAGESGEYIVTVRNIGKKTDTYDMEVISKSSIYPWFTLEEETITLVSGETQQFTLYVDVPDEAGSKSYPVSVKADGAAIDIDRVTLSTVKRAMFFDVEAKKPTVSPSEVSTDKGYGVAVKVPVSFVDLSGESSGEYITVKLYVEGEAVETEKVYIPSGEAKTLTFYVETDSSPINSDPGTYKIYAVASIDEEIDRSPTATLIVVKTGAAAITGISPTVFNTSANSEIKLTLTVKNEDLKDNTYTISADSTGSLAGKVTATPSLLTIPEGETKTQEIALKLGNAGNGTYAVDVKVTADGTVTKKTIDVDVKGGQVAELAETEEKKGGNGPTGAILTPGGTAAAIVAAILLAALLAYYYQTTGGFEKLKESLFAAKKPGEIRGTEPAEEDIFEEEKPKKASSKPYVWEGMNLERIKAKAEKVVGDWNPKDAENVLLNLENIRDEFKSTAEAAGRIKKKLGTMAEETSASIKKKMAFTGDAGLLKPLKDAEGK